jgi:hypothetical protein
MSDLNALRQLLLSDTFKRVDALEQSSLQHQQQNLQHIKILRRHILKLQSRLHTQEAWHDDNEKRIYELACFLPEVIKHASAQTPTTHPEALAEDFIQALQSPVRTCLQSSIQADPKPLTDALFPVMGPAIRKSINETLRGILQTLNDSLEQGFSLQGWLWRIEGWSTRRSYSEIVLKHTMVYQVEQVFLIQRETGLLMQHVHRENIDMGDSDAVSAMLTAIQDFIRDSFSSNKTEELNSVTIGEYTVWIEGGPQAILACVIRGVAQETFRHTMHEFLEYIHAQNLQRIQDFEGDSDDFSDLAPTLEKMLHTQRKTEKKATKKLFSLPLLLFVGLLMGVLAYWQYPLYLYRQAVDSFLNRLEQTAGIVITHAQIESDTLLLRGLRDPLAVTVESVAQAVPLLAEKNILIQSNLRHYQDLDPTFVQQRLQHYLSPIPDSVKYQFTQQQLKLQGHATAEWISRARNSILLGGVNTVDIQDLHTTDTYLLNLAQQQLKPSNTVQMRVENSTLYVSGRAHPAEIQHLLSSSAEMNDLHAVDFSALANQDPQLHAELTAYIEQTTVYFTDAMRRVSGQQNTLLQLRDAIQNLLRISRELDQPQMIQIIGYTDGLGSYVNNLWLGVMRADSIKVWLEDNGLERGQVLLSAPDVVQYNETWINLSARKTHFKVIMMPDEEE